MADPMDQCPFFFFFFFFFFHCVNLNCEAFLVTLTLDRDIYIMAIISSDGIFKQRRGEMDLAGVFSGMGWRENRKRKSV